MVAVDAGQPAVSGVVGHSHRVRITAPWFAGEQLTEEECKSKMNAWFHLLGVFYYCIMGTHLRCICLPCIHHTGNVSSKTVWAGQSTPEVQINGAESTNGPIGTATEDQVICDG